jgi:hypothetical protein
MPKLNNTERQMLINQYRILEKLSTCPHEKKAYELKVDILQHVMESHMGDYIFDKTEESDDPDFYYNASKEFYDILCMYEYVRTFLIKNNITYENLTGHKLKVFYDGHESGSFPYYNIDVLQQDNRFLNIEFEDQHFPAFEMHKERLQEYKKNGITTNNYKIFIDNLEYAKFRDGEI